MHELCFKVPVNNQSNFNRKSGWPRISNELILHNNSCIELRVSIYSGHYITSVNCCNRTFYCNDNKITEFDMINKKNSSTAYVVIYKLIT